MRAGSLPADLVLGSTILCVTLAACERSPADPFDPRPPTLSVRDVFSSRSSARMELIRDPASAFAACWQTLSGAQRHVEVVAPLDDDVLMRALRGHLAILARRGVSWRWRAPQGDLSLVIVDETVGVAIVPQSEDAGGFVFDGGRAIGALLGTLEQLQVVETSAAPDPRRAEKDEELVLTAGALGAWLEGQIPALPLHATLPELERAAADAWGRPPSTRALAVVRDAFERIADRRTLRGSLPLLPSRRHRAELRLLIAKDPLPRAVARARRRLLVDGPAHGAGPRLQSLLAQKTAAGISVFAGTGHSGTAIIDDELIVFGAVDPEEPARRDDALLLVIRSRGLARETRRQLEGSAP